MCRKKLKLPAVILAIGLVVAILSCFLTGIVKTPVITEQDFNYSATYKLNGETKTIEGVYRCTFENTSGTADPLERCYSGTFLSGDHNLAQIDDLQLRLVFIFSDNYLMGDGAADDEYSEMVQDPYLAVYDREGCEYHDEEKLALFDAELISWELPQPIENSFRFSGFSVLYIGSMLAMLAVGILTVIAMMIAVKKDQNLPWNGLNRASAVVNFLVMLGAIPFLVVVITLMALTMTDEFMYQVCLCIPALTAFTVAASIALRRTGYPKTGFFIQFAGPALFALYVVIESVIYNLFS